jgi:hypothetical protein
LNAEELLPEFVAAFVPLQISEYQRQGGPTPFEFALACDHWQRRLDEGEGTELFWLQPGKTAAAAGNLIRLIACMAFAPGGITVFGSHFEAGLTITDLSPAQRIIQMSLRRLWEDKEHVI